MNIRLAAAAQLFLNAILLHAATVHQHKAPDTRVYNPHLQVGSASEGHPLICDKGEVRPNPQEVSGPFTNIPDLDKTFGMRLNHVSLSYKDGSEPNKFDVMRTISLEVNSNYIQAHTVIADREQHGCSDELYPTGDSFSSSGDRLTFHTRIFVAKRKCVHKPFDGDGAVCSSETSVSEAIQYHVRTEKTYEECMNGGRETAVVVIERENVTSSREENDNCLGIKNFGLDKVAGLVTGLLVGPTGGLVVGAVVQNQLPSSFSLPDVSPDLLTFSRPEADAETLCPAEHPITIRATAPNVSMIDVTERMDNVRRSGACHMMDIFSVQTHALAEMTTPTTTVEVQPGDSWWAITARLWGDGKLYPLLEVANPDLRRLHPGMTIKVPALIPLLKDDSLLKRGDTVWGLRARLHLDPRQTNGEVAHMIRPKPQNPSKVYPFSRVVNK
jgi:LysM domain